MGYSMSGTDAPVFENHKDVLNIANREISQNTDSTRIEGGTAIEQAIDQIDQVYTIDSDNSPFPEVRANVPNTDDQTQLQVAPFGGIVVHFLCIVGRLDGSHLPLDFYEKPTSTLGTAQSQRMSKLDLGELAWTRMVISPESSILLQDIFGPNNTTKEMHPLGNRCETEDSEENVKSLASLQRGIAKLSTGQYQWIRSYRHLLNPGLSNGERRSPKHVHTELPRHVRLAQLKAKTQKKLTATGSYSTLPPYHVLCLESQNLLAISIPRMLCNPCSLLKSIVNRWA